MDLLSVTSFVHFYFAWREKSSHLADQRSFSPPNVLIYFWLCWVFVVVQPRPSCDDWGLLSSCGARFSHCRGFSCCGAGASAVAACGLKGCDARASLPRGLWALPRPGIGPVFPALAEGFHTTESNSKDPKGVFIQTLSLTALWTGLQAVDCQVLQNGYTHLRGCAKRSSVGRNIITSYFRLILSNVFVFSYGKKQRYCLNESS